MELTTSLLIESWILYAVGVLMVACRMASRRIKLGKWINLMMDDYLMLFALANFTGVVVSINEVAANGSNYMSPEDAAALTPEGVQRAIYGSIMTFVLEIFTITGLWTVKACLLILYARLTRHSFSRQHVLVKAAAGYSAVTYVVVLLMFVFFWCHPTYEYWAVPVRIDQCATYYNHMIFSTACDISSDLLLLLIPIPIIVQSRLPIRRKLILTGILGLGIFNILAAVLNRYYNFSNPNSYVFLYWYVAEVGIAIMVGNLPLCWPMMRALLGSRTKSDTRSSQVYTISGGKRRHRRPRSLLSTTILGVTMRDRYGEQIDVAVETDELGRDQLPGNRGDHVESASQASTIHRQGAAGAEAGRAVRPHSIVHVVGSNEEPMSPGVGGDKIMVVTTIDVSSSQPPE